MIEMRISPNALGLFSSRRQGARNAPFFRGQMFIVGTFSVHDEIVSGSHRLLFLTCRASALGGIYAVLSK